MTGLDTASAVLICNPEKRATMRKLMTVFSLVFILGFFGCTMNMVPEVSTERSLSMSSLPLLVNIPGLKNQANSQWGKIHVIVHGCNYTDRFESYVGDTRYPELPLGEEYNWNVYFTNTNFAWFVNRAKNFGCNTSDMTVTYTFYNNEPVTNSVTIREHITE